MHIVHIHTTVNNCRKGNYLFLSVVEEERSGKSCGTESSSGQGRSECKQFLHLATLQSERRNFGSCDFVGPKKGRKWGRYISNIESGTTFLATDIYWLA